MAGQGFRSDALQRLNKVLEGFGESLVDIQEAERLLKLENDADAEHRYPGADVFEDNLNVRVVSELSDQLITLKSALLKTIMGKVKCFVESVPQMQEMLVGIDGSLRAAPGGHEGAVVSKQITKSQLANADTVTARAKAGEASKAAKQRLRTRPQILCRHYCLHHQEVMDKSLWKKLPAEVVERVCAYLPVSHILELCKDPRSSWNSYDGEPVFPASVNFRQACAKVHPKMLGVFGSQFETNEYFLAVFDFRSYSWFRLDFQGLFRDYDACYMEPLFGHDGGLVCLLPDFLPDGTESSVLVFNPLTGDKKYIPLSDCSRESHVAVLLQLHMDIDTGSYKLMLLTKRGGSDVNPVCEAECYDSKTGQWSTTNPVGLFGHGALSGDPERIFFDSATKRVLRFRPPRFEGIWDVDYFKDHRFVLQPYSRNYDDLEIVTSVWQADWTALLTVRIFLKYVSESYRTRLFASNNFLLVVADDSRVETFEHNTQRIALVDRKTEELKVGIPQIWTENYNSDRFLMENLRFMCDLSWHAIP